MNIAICDKNTGEYIQNQALRYMCDNSIDGNCFVFETVADLMARNELFDIAILDADLTGINCVNICNFLKRQNNAVALIFVADGYLYLDYAFDVGARRYLVRPVDETLLSALTSAIDYVNNETAECYLQDSGTIIRVAKSSIIYLEILGRKTKVVTKNDCFISRIKMQDFQKSLNPAQFASPHKSFYVNMEQISEFRRFSGQYYISMSNNNIIPVTRTRKADFEKAYFQFLNNKKLLY